MMSVNQFRAHIANELGLATQAAVGKRYGVSHVAVGKWLSGERNPSKTVLILAAYLIDKSAGNWPVE